MMFNKIAAGALLLTCLNFQSFGQTVTQPNFGLKSHETLSIRKIESDAQKTVFYMTIENRITGGNFCADRNINIIYPDGKKSRLTSSSGIPVCPETYEFKTIGEKLDFKLAFPPLRQGTKWIDLIEECSDNCFSFCGITLDTALNRKIDEAYALSGSVTAREGIKYFKAILDETGSENLGSEGMLYINIISLSREAGDEDLAKEWYKKLLSSGCPRLSQYVKYLNDKGIKY